MPVGDVVVMRKAHGVAALVDPGALLAGAAMMGAGGAAMLNGGSTAAFEIGVLKTPDKESVEAVARDPDTIHAAVMSMRLIKPTKGRTRKTAALAAAPSVTWGVQAVRADTSPFSGAGVTVAVLDTGIDANHPAFAGVQLIQKDFTGEGNGDQNGHGTHVAGTIFGRPINGFRYSVAPGVTKALIGKVLNAEGRGSSDQIAEAIQWAAKEGADVINISIGSDFANTAEILQQQFGLPPKIAVHFALRAYRETVRFYDSIGAMLSRPTTFGSLGDSVLLVAAAGNENVNTVNPAFEVTVTSPAEATGFLSVGAMGRSNDATGSLTPAVFSNTGARLTGPGVGILSAKVGGDFVELNGTSMATPHVVGVAALWAQKLKAENNFSRQSLLDALEQSAKKAHFAGGISLLDVGLGMVQAPQA